jgi:hypothetical protein|tara:strand:+ start:94 stop:507 length:414 start_codon:yes stop_codon:yes gene_type:complete
MPKTDLQSLISSSVQDVLRTPSQSLEGNYSQIVSALEDNKDTPFVKRIRDPYIYPTIPDPRGGDDMSTHLMADSDNRAYPLIQMNEDGKLEYFDGDNALANALRNNNTIDFKTPEEAAYFAKHYKDYWDKEKQLTKP